MTIRRVLVLASLVLSLYAPLGTSSPDRWSIEELGRHLFYDRALSFNQQVACADCHHQAFAFSDSQRFSVGALGDELPRNTLALINLTDRDHFGWADNTQDSLATQMMRPLFNSAPVEMGWADHEQSILERLNESVVYREARQALFPDTEMLGRNHVINAIEAFEHTLISRQSIFDQWLSEDQRPTEKIAEGFRLFASDRLGCSGCHNGPDLGGRGYADTGLGGDDAGLAIITGRDSDRHRFLVPTLRNIAVTAPYMHDGRFDTLEQVITFYASGPAPEQGLHTFDLTSDESAALVAFLRSLTDNQFLTNPALGPPATR